MYWTDNLPYEVHARLANCKSRREDIPTLTAVKWRWMCDKGMHTKGFTKEDALVSVLELLDCNGQFFDLTADEEADILSDGEVYIGCDYGEQDIAVVITTPLSSEWHVLLKSGESYTYPIIAQVPNVVLDWKHGKHRHITVDRLDVWADWKGDNR